MLVELRLQTAGTMRSPCAALSASLLLLLLLLWARSSVGCNKALCASDVSKCLIQELCQCRPGEGNCSCCKECMLCLGTLWDECCDCVETKKQRIAAVDSAVCKQKSCRITRT